MCVTRYLWFLTWNVTMNLEGLTPQQRKFIVDLSNRIYVLESKLVVLQARMVKIDPELTSTLARDFQKLNLN